ncbi:MAG: ABC transporter substrate-binding protein [Eubacteriaceae bacterium]|jgi:D-methionine transport system substrate-binding protein|nr:ABC transporter substrate-binding protein [Eubacteriaceae bacterium]
MKRRTIAGLLAALLCLLVLAGCGGGAADDKKEDASKAGDDKTIVIGATPTPHGEILEEVRAALEEDGYALEIVEFTDYVLPNNALDKGDLDANFFQHLPYLEDFNAKNSTELVSAGAIHYEPMGLFAGKIASIDELADGAEIGVPNDTTNEARALLLLQEKGLIKLKADAGLDATPKDIEENPKNLSIKELEAAQLGRSLQDMDMAVINGNYALGADLKISDALAIEEKESLAAQTYGNVIAVRKGEESSEKTQALLKALNTDAIKKFIEEKYEGAVVPLF